MISIYFIKFFSIINSFFSSLGTSTYFYLLIGGRGQGSTPSDATAGREKKTTQFLGALLCNGINIMSMSHNIHFTTISYL